MAPSAPLLVEGVKGQSINTCVHRCVGALRCVACRGVCVFFGCGAPIWDLLHSTAMQMSRHVQSIYIYNIEGLRSNRHENTQKDSKRTLQTPKRSFKANLLKQTSRPTQFCGLMWSDLQVSQPTTRVDEKGWVRHRRSQKHELPSRLRTLAV